MTKEQLQAIMPHLPAAKADAYFPHLAAAMQEAGITTARRQAAFLAQIAHESAELRYMAEIWGPTAQQLKYERPAGAQPATQPPYPLWQKLGNTEPGDGHRFFGRGPIQLTGRDGYRRAGKALGLDLVAAPEKAQTPEVAFRVAGWYWTQHGLNALADAHDFKAITKAINGGLNGEEDRERYWAKARQVLGDL